MMTICIPARRILAAQAYVGEAIWVDSYDMEGQWAFDLRGRVRAKNLRCNFVSDDGLEEMILGVRDVVRTEPYTLRSLSHATTQWDT